MGSPPAVEFDIDTLSTIPAGAECEPLDTMPPVSIPRMPARDERRRKLAPARAPAVSRLASPPVAEEAEWLPNDDDHDGWQPIRRRCGKEQGAI